MALIKCPECAAEVSSAASACPKCGHPIMMQVAPASPISAAPGSRGPAGAKHYANRVVFAVFAIFLGSFGLHKFYAGQANKGILYLVFCWTFIPGIVGFIEGLIALVNDDQTFAQKHNVIPT